MGIFDRHIKRISKIIDKYGQTVSIKSIPYTVADGSKPWDFTEGLETSTNVKMLFLSPNQSGNSSITKELLQYLTGTENISGKIRGYLAADSIVPKMNNVVIRNGEELKIFAIDTIAPNEQTLMYILEFSL